MLGFGKKKVNFAAPFDGHIVPVTEVPDPMFSGKMLGDGYAVIPQEGADTLYVLAPADGTLVKVFKTGHAFSMKSADGIELLVHIGLETVELKGEGFSIVKDSGDVKAGDPIVEVDLRVVREAKLNPITVVVFTKKGQLADLKVNEGDANSKPAAVGTLA